MKINIGSKNKIKNSNIGENNKIIKEEPKENKIIVDILIGLFVTVIGGIILYYILK